MATLTFFFLHMNVYTKSVGGSYQIEIAMLQQSQQLTYYVKNCVTRCQQ